MQLNYLDAVSSVITLMKQPDSPCSSVRMHKTCYVGLFKYLLEESKPFSIPVALEWLETKKPEITYEMVSQYRGALFRLEHYLLFGNIECENCRSEDKFFCNSGMSETFYRLMYELKAYFGETQYAGYYHRYSKAITNFFRLATQMGIGEPEAITIDVLLEYWRQYCMTTTTLSKRQNMVSAITILMKYLSSRGDVPCCYQRALVGGNADALAKMLRPQLGKVLHPSMELETKVDGYLNSLDFWKYKDSSKELHRHDLNWYFLFLELNRISHSPDAVAAWISAVPEHTEQADASVSLWAHRVYTVRMFVNYLQGIQTSDAVCSYPAAADELPVWSRGILADFVESRRRDGMAKSTLTMCRAAGYRFFRFIDDCGIICPEEITPEVIMSFHGQDEHSTPESKNAYSIKLRQLLNFMAEAGMVPPTLIFSVSTKHAPRRNIVDVLSDEMVEWIYEYRKNASTPIELRDTAIVMLGLRMGIRGADILNLKTSDFNWRARTVTFVQKKTKTVITLPVPTDVGNSVYQYILNGRPQSSEPGNGFIFIHHQAPYAPLKTSVVCRYALKRILSASGFELEPGQGFHMTRKTFATRILRAGNRSDDISDALGHARKETAEVYLARDEAGMRLCPLDFGGMLP